MNISTGMRQILCTHKIVFYSDQDFAAKNANKVQHHDDFSLILHVDVCARGQLLLDPSPDAERANAAAAAAR